MDNLAFAVNATLPIFLTMLLGMALRRVGLVDERFAASLNRLVFRVALPVLLFQDLATQDFASAWDGRYVLFCLVVTAASIAIAALVARLVVGDRARRGEFVQVSYRSSAAILGIAFIQNIYGDDAGAMGPLMILGSVPLYNAAAVVVLAVTAERPGGEAESRRALAARTAKGVLTNPIIWGIVVGLLWSLLRVPMPQVLASTVHNVAVLATPLGLMAMGASFEPHRAKADVPAALVASAIKLVGFVALFLPAAVALGFRDQQLVALLVMLGSASTVSCYVMAREMGHEGTLTATTVMITTFACALTLTLWLWLVRSLGLVG